MPAEPVFRRAHVRDGRYPVRETWVRQVEEARLMQAAELAAVTQGMYEDAEERYGVFSNETNRLRQVRDRAALNLDRLRGLMSEEGT